jgi:hypothetical protein
MSRISDDDSALNPCAPKTVSAAAFPVRRFFQGWSIVSLCSFRFSPTKIFSFSTSRWQSPQALQGSSSRSQHYICLCFEGFPESRRHHLEILPVQGLFQLGVGKGTCDGGYELKEVVFVTLLSLSSRALFSISTSFVLASYALVLLVFIASCFFLSAEVRFW